jgi:hypothetical protein
MEKLTKTRIKIIHLEGLFLCDYHTVKQSATYSHTNFDNYLLSYVTGVINSKVVLVRNAIRFKSSKKIGGIAPGIFNLCTI